MNALVFNAADRAREKQASRDEDERALAAGEKTREDLRQENARFSFRGARIVRRRGPLAFF